MELKNKNHKFLKEFCPEITVLDTESRDFLTDFNAGAGKEGFNEFLREGADEYRSEGNGVTYIIWNTLCEAEGESVREAVAYFTIAANAIPYIDRIRIDEEEYSKENWGIPVLEIKMFAVHDKYQDVFYTYEGKALPIAAWCLLAIINYANKLLDSVLGFKALFLHSVPEAEAFYIKNGFQDMRINMHPFVCIDSDMRSMWMPLRNIHINYEK